MSTKQPIFVYPPDYDKAQRHRLANRIFKGSTQSNQQCECCHRRLGEEKVQTECDIDPKQLSFLGPGVPLFFLFVRSSIILLVLMTIIFSGFCLYSNVSSSDCDSSASCLSDGFNKMSIVNKQSHEPYLSIQSYLALAYVVVAIIFFHYMRYQARKLQQQCDQIVDSPSDYAIIIRGIPPGSTEQDIQDMLEQKKKQMTPEQLEETDNVKVVKILMSYYLRDYVQTMEKNKEAWIQHVKDNTLDNFVPEQLPELKDTSHIAIVVFELQATKDYFIHEASCTQSIQQFFCTPCIPVSQLTVNGKKVGIERAPEPDQITWQNAGITMGGAISRKIAFGVISILILLVGGVAQYGLSILSKQAASDSFWKLMFQYGNPVIVMVWNSIILSSLELMTQKERNETLTEYQSVLLVKVTFLQFFNAGVFVVATKIAANYETFNINNGIIGQISIIMILNAITPNVVHFAKKYFEIIHKLQIFLAKHGWFILNQIEINKLTSGNIINLPKRYAYALKTLILTALYAPAVPVVVPVALIGIILFYFIEKLLITRSYSMPPNISSMTFGSAMELLEYFLITFALGQLVIYAYFYSYQVGELPLDWLITIFITLALAIFNSALPMDAINQKLFPIQESSRSDLKYTEVESQFQVTYDMFNPAYKTKRVRNNNKDVIRELLHDNKIQDNNDMARIMKIATAQNQKQMTREPLLGCMGLVNNSAGQTQIEMEMMKNNKNGGENGAAPVIKINDLALQEEKEGKNGDPLSLRGEKDTAHFKEKTPRGKKAEVKKKQSLRFKLLEFKEVKPSQRSSYQDLVSKIMAKNEPSSNQEHKQSLLIPIQRPQQTNPDSHQGNREVGETRLSGSRNSPHQVKKSEKKISNSQLAFPQPHRQQLGTYDPIKVNGSYKKFFKNPDKMISKEGHYMNSKLVVDFLGTPFSSLLKTMEAQQQPQKPSQEQ